MTANVLTWSTTAASNATADADINWSEGQLPGTVNGSARAMMQAHAVWIQGGQGMSAPAMINGTLSVSVGANAATFSLKTTTNGVPSATDPVTVLFRTGLGVWTPIVVTAATSVVVSSGSTLGTADTIPFRIWVVAFNDAGTVRLGVINCVVGGATPTRIVQLYEPDTGQNSTAEGGAGAADSAGVIYTGTAVTGKGFRILGYADWNGGLATAGTWSSTMGYLQLFGAGIRLPGDVVQEVNAFTGAMATGATTVPVDDTIPQITEGNEYMTLPIQPAAASNVLWIEAQGNYGTDSAGVMVQALFQDAITSSIAVTMHRMDTANLNRSNIVTQRVQRALTTSVQTFRTRAGMNGAGNTTFNGSGGARLYGGALASYMRIREIMG